MPTRYQVPAEVQPATLVTDQQMDSPDGRVEAKKICEETAAGEVPAAAGRQVGPPIQGRHLPPQEAPLLIAATEHPRRAPRTRREDREGFRELLKQSTAA